VPEHPAVTILNPTGRFPVVLTCEHASYALPQQYDTLGIGSTEMEAHLRVAGSQRTIKGTGNGPIDAFIAALTFAGLFTGKFTDYYEHAIGAGSDATAAAYVEVDTGSRDTIWGVGLHESIVSASLRAVVSAVDQMHRAGLTP